MTSHDYYQSSTRVRSPRRLFSHTQTTWIGYAGVVALYALVFGLWQAKPVPFEVHALGVLVAALCLFPMSLWTARRSHEIPAFELICVAYLLAFSSPLYFQKNEVIIYSVANTFSWSETSGALASVAVGICAFLAGYYLLFENRINFRALQMDLPIHPHKRRAFITTAFGVGLTLVVLRGVGADLSAGALNSLVTAVQNLVYVAIVLLGYRVMRGQESSHWKIILGCAVVISAVFGLASGMLELAILPLLLLVIIKWNVSRRAPLALFALGLCGFVMLNSVKMSYRSQAWAKNTHMSVGERVGLWMDLLQGTSQKPLDFEDTFRKSMSRFDLLHSFVRVQQFTPGAIPFYEGQSYSYLVYGWIPRFVWPDKPTAQGANVTFAVDYGFLDASQTSTTMIGIGHLPEAYANFGNWGVVFIMTLQGMFLAAVGKMLNGPQSEGGKAIYLALMIFFLNGIGSATASLFMSIPLTVIISGVILRFFATGWRAAPTSTGL